MSIKKQYDEIYGARVLYLLLLPFKSQKAFTLGLIDQHGKILRQPKTPEERDALTMLHKVVFELKQMIDKLPQGQTKLKQFAVALHFMNQNQIPMNFQESVEEGSDKKYLEMLKFVVENELRLVEEELEVEEALKELTEDGTGVGAIGGGSAPTNSVDGIEPHDQPVIDKKKKKRLDYERIFSRKSVSVVPKTAD